MASYYRPDSVADAVGHYSTVKNSAYLAGGQSLLAALNRRERRCDQLIDVRGLEALRGIVMDARGLRLGAAVTLNELLLHQGALVAMPVLADALSQVGNHTIRNRSTIGGHVALADGLSELNLLLRLTGATIVTSERELTIEKLLLQHRSSGLTAGELIVAIQIPAAALTDDYGFCEFTLRPSGGRALVCAAVRGDATGPVAAVLAGVTATQIVLGREALTRPAERLTHALHEAEDIEPVARWPREYRLKLGLEALERAHAQLPTSSAP
jgi:aerobic carbon-monoxide dehydrogenase medium subunit